MRLSLLTATAAAALLLGQAGAMAQSNNETNQPNATSSTPAEQPSNATTASHGSLRAEVRNMLQKEGFTDIRVMPSSFMIRVKDKDGNPVVMSVSADSFAEAAEVGGRTSGAANDSTNDNDATAAADTAPNMGGGESGSQFVSIPSNDELSSNLVGLDVYNNSNQDIGQIKDIAMNRQGRAQAYIVSVGGFLGVGTHYVAVNPQDVKVAYNDSDKKWHATMNATSDQLKAAPEFKYNGRWNASKT
jgi:sporulation protein YlmC with PRC-barrel domain